MRICYVAVDVAIPHSRGASTHVYEVARHLAEHGHEVHVVSRRIGFAQRSYEFSRGFHIHRLLRGVLIPLPFSSYAKLESAMEKNVGLVSRLYEAYLFTVYAILAGLSVSRIVKKHGLDVIIERETSFGAGALASIFSSRPMILEVIGPRYRKLSVTRAAKIIVYTKLMVRSFVPAQKLEFVTAAVDVESFRPDLIERTSLREKLGLEGSVVIGYVGIFAKWHGVEELVEASTKILEEHPKARFLMVGPYYENTRNLAQSSGVLKACVFTGAVSYNSVPKYINASDIMVAPYNPAKSELRSKYGIGSPLKIFEYMACAKPVVATSIDPITRIVKNGETGVLIRPGDSEALYKAISDLMRNKMTASKLGKAARKEVERCYTWDVFVRSLEKVLIEIISSWT